MSRSIEKLSFSFFSSTIYRIRIHPLDRIVTFDRRTLNIHTPHRSSINASNPVARVINYAIDLFLVTAAISLRRISNSILRWRWRSIRNVNFLHSCTQTMYEMRFSVECWENRAQLPASCLAAYFQNVYCECEHSNPSVNFCFQNKLYKQIAGAWHGLGTYSQTSHMWIVDVFRVAKIHSTAETDIHVRRECVCSENITICSDM